MAGFYYEDFFRWRIICDANLEVIEDPHWIFPDEELVIPGVSGPMVAVEVEPTTTTEPTIVATTDSVEAPTLDLTQPDPAVVGGVTVVTPTGETQPSLVRTRSYSERDRRSRFYRDPSANSTVQAAAQAEYSWVSRASTWSAEWIGPASLEELEFDGQVESFVAEGELRTAFPYTWVRLNLEPGFQVDLGDALQIC